MTEKVVSLSGGLILGMAFALLLSVSAIHTITSPMQIENSSIPRFIGFKGLQSLRAAPSSTAPTGTAPAPTNAPPPATENQGRIVRIATVSETSEPVSAAPSSSGASVNIPKNHYPASSSTLQQMHRQHTSIAETASGSSFLATGHAARQPGNNFTAIAEGGQSADQGSSHPPVAAGGKPQTAGSPAVAANDPEINEGDKDQPAVAGLPPEPNSIDDNCNPSPGNSLRLSGDTGETSFSRRPGTACPPQRNRPEQ